jgi:hypothetical protein
MATRNLVLVFLSLLLFNACRKDSVTDNNPPNGNPIDTTTNNNPNLHKPGNTLLIDDLVLYTTDGAHRDVQLIKNFVNRNFPDQVNLFNYGQTSVDYNNNALSLEFLDNNRVKLKDTIMEIVSKTDTEMLLSPMDSTNMPGPESQWLGHCIQLYDQVPQYNPYSICKAAGGSCKKYRRMYPVIISGGKYYLPQVQSALVSNCIIIFYNSAPMPNYFNKDLLNNGILQNKDTLLVQVNRLPLTK